ncbi:hypothetical protein QC764_0039690 [Podospora pseudoanserina]|uniref:Secreted protein n=1 Tax=Podospora pseudoanserina TaxID=2609844 RepID=A0ABR0IHY3_9PEZI|nr:hypothetical protein QC764_0039690 [Podospora pseudoanserina]
MTLMTLMTWVIVVLFLGDEIGEVGVRLEMDRGNGQTRHSVALAPVKPRSDVGHFHRGTTWMSTTTFAPLCRGSGLPRFASL